MLNNRDEKYEGGEEGEYHFSDDEVSYEVETESPKPAVSVEKESFLSRLTRSKRMLISLVVFLVLIFIVYKMVSPSDTTPSTTITAPVVNQQAATQQPLPQNPIAQNPMLQNQTTQPTVAQAPQPQSVPVQTMPVQPVVTTQNATPVTTTPTTVQTTTTTQTVAPTTPNPPIQTTINGAANQPVVSTTQTVTQPTQPTVPQTTISSTTQTTSSPEPIASMPAVIPVQTSPTNTIDQAPIVSTVTTTSPESERLMNNLQAEYSQRVNEFVTQNKAMQDQVKTLNSRVALLETRMNQLIQVLTRQANTGQMQPRVQPQARPKVPMEVVETAPVIREEPKISYTVQAIIPGRAWLRADNGETVTVAEGDTIRGLGRVTKIDPYDGVVEVNTGHKVISLSYGSTT